MKAADQAILQLLGPPKPLELTPGNIARNTGLSRGYTSSRLSVLVDNGLVEVDEQEGSHPFYNLSDQGRAYLEGKLSLEDLGQNSEI
ncbi:winged helix-turn-helix domain-containing protein [Natrinema longum]|uniref:Winged helix-turn-helix transcriptional regulator n=1 Tax=Natrinema longum TaxID=370324 RepID=A0A8A2U7E9_9EURY|nr:winged helix-turn-helix domain-containing protein [Natrinema longum]MBZ6494355.1 winged helix-turn-helix domain-containing protein [Natrinema longum]QSW84322.1 winged helix-turn-helix transcriptional regulator [Natrinema longum]